MIRVWCLSDVCLSVAYIGPKSRIERPMKTKIGTECGQCAHVTRDSNTTFKVKRSKVNLQGAGRIVAASRTACCICHSEHIDWLIDWLIHSFIHSFTHSLARMWAVAELNAYVASIGFNTALTPILQTLSKHATAESIRLGSDDLEWPLTRLSRLLYSY